MTSVPFLRAPRFISTLFGISLAVAGCNPASIDLSGEVHGTALTTTVSRQPGVPPMVQGWEGRLVEAWVPSASGYERFTGVIDSSGQFRIANVPAGPYWLVFPDEVTARPGQAKVFVWTEARELDLGYQTLSPELQGEMLPLAGVITGLSPVEADDKMELSPTSGSWLLTWGPRPLGTQQVEFSPPPKFFGVRPGERVSAQQWRERQQGGLTATSIVKYGMGEAPAEPGTALTIALTDPPARQLDLHVDHAGFFRQLGSTPPSGATVRTFFDFTLLAAPDLAGETLSRPEVALHLWGPIEETQNPSMSGILYSDPHPTDWARGYELTYSASYPCTAQDTVSGCGSIAYARGPLSELTTGTVQPRLSRPQGLVIDGKDASAPGAEVSQSPAVRWQAPASGQVSTYLLWLIRLVPQANGSTSEEAAGLFITSKTELTLLPSVLQPGGRYFFKLHALGGLDTDATVAPRRASLRKTPAEAAVWSAPFTVADAH